MLDLFKDYGSNIALYPKFQEFFRTRQPPTLIVWGRNDVIFPPEGARAYLRDVPKARLHLLDTGHFALEDKGQEIATLIRDFLGQALSNKSIGQKKTPPKRCFRKTTSEWKERGYEGNLGSPCFQLTAFPEGKGEPWFPLFRSVQM